MRANFDYERHYSFGANLNLPESKSQSVLNSSIILAKYYKKYWLSAVNYQG